MGYTWAEHTSEVELHLEAASELEVFEQALQAFAELVADEPAAEPGLVVREVVLAASDRAALLAAWLDELVYMAESEDLVPERVERLHLSDGGLRATVRVVGRYGIVLPDRQLACAPLSSPEGRSYMGAMAAAANFAWANRATLAHRVREAIAQVLGPSVAEATRQVYDLAHNVAKPEVHHGCQLCVRRKGATRAFPAGSPEIPEDYRRVGQPVFIPGSMGTSSFVLAGAPAAMDLSFGTVCHGAGRRMSRTGARKQMTGAELRRQLEAKGIVVRCPINRGPVEEAPFAYKDVDRVVAVVERAGLARRVAQLVPLGVAGEAGRPSPGFARSRGRRPCIEAGRAPSRLIFIGSLCKTGWCARLPVRTRSQGRARPDHQGALVRAAW